MAPHIVQLSCNPEPKQGPVAVQSQTQQVGIRSQHPVTGLGSCPGGGGRPVLYEVQTNKGNEHSQQSHGSDGTPTSPARADGDGSWEVRAFAEDSASCSGQWPPRSYACSYCRREFRTAQALGGHMNVHRRERAQANNMAMLRSTAQQAAAAATAVAPTQLNVAAGGGGSSQQAQWCLYSPMGVSPAAHERRAFFYSSLAPAAAIIAMTSSSGGSSQITSRSSQAITEMTGGMFGITQISSSPASSPNSNGSRSSGSSVITKSSSPAGSGHTPYRRTTSAMSGDNASLAQKLQLGAFQPYPSCPLARDAAPLLTQELIQIRPSHHNPTLFPKSVVMRGPVEDVGFLDLELRLGPA